MASESAASPQVLLVAADVAERRLLYAQLLEAGYRVLPLPGLVDSMRVLRAARGTPPLILLDTFGDAAASPARVADLLRLCRKARLVLLIGATDSKQWESLHPQVATVLRRPLSVGEVVDAVERVFRGINT
jgi:hypothetical protein